MKKNLVTIILAAMVVAGCLFADTNEFVALAFIGFVGGVVAVNDYRRIKAYEELKAYEESKAKCENVEYLLDCVEFGEWEMNRQKKYERAKANSENLDYLTDCVMFGEWEMN